MGVITSPHDVRPAARRITIVTPAYNEEDCVEELARRLRIVFDCLSPEYEFEAIVVENGSRDRTYEKLLAVRAEDPRFKILQLSRNFMFEGAVTAGLSLATGDAVVIMSSDLQDPPELIPDFIRAWEDGNDIVYQIIRQRTDEGAVRKVGTRAFYWLINRLSDQDVPRNVSDFRLVDRRAYEALRNMPERTRMLRAMWAWVGFRSIGIEHDRPPRHGGSSTYSLRKWIAFGVRGIITSSYTPLKAIPTLGIGLSFLSFVLLFGFVVRFFTRGVPFDGFGTIVALMLLLFGTLFFLLGIVAEYIGLIFEEVRGRPSFIVRAAHGLRESQSFANEPAGRRTSETEFAALRY